MNLGEPCLIEFVHHPLRILGVRFRPDDTAPELVTPIAIAARDGGLIFHVLLEMPAVD